MVTPTFDPKRGLYGLWPNKTKPTSHLGAAGQHIGYLQSVLKFEAGQVQLNIRALPGPWDFGPMTRDAVINFQNFWGLTVDGIVGPQTWGVIDWCAKGNPT